MTRGFFIAIEGGEGAGKSTQAKILADRLRETAYDVVVTREPGGTRIGERIRAITHDTENVDLHAKTEAYLMAASRAQHVTEIIEPALASGKIVICDRFLDSSIAYQGYGRKLGAEKITELNALAVDGIIPDITILLDVPVDVGLSRRNGSHKNLDRLDTQQKDFYDRVNDGYRTLAKRNSGRYGVIDATRSIPDVASRIWSVVSEVLGKRNGKAN